MQEFADFLGSQPPFDALNADDLTRLARRIEVEYFAAGTVIVPAGSPPLDHLYVVRTGAVESTMTEEPSPPAAQVRRILLPPVEGR